METRVTATEGSSREQAGPSQELPSFSARVGSAFLRGAKFVIRPFYRLLPSAIRSRIRARIDTHRREARHRLDVSEFWSKPQPSDNIYWTEHPVIRLAVNEQITEVPWLWPLQVFKVGWAYRPLPLGISIGCGTGALERNVRLLRICDRVDAYDVSPASIREAKHHAEEEGIDGIRYRVKDCNRIRLPQNHYDIAFFHGSLHHIDDPRRLLREVWRSLKPHGLIYVDDYVGPSRGEWSDQHLADAREEWNRLPAELRLQPVNPPLDWSDPSEMIASSSILPAIRESFDVLEERPYWGNLLFPLICATKGRKLLEPENEDLIRRLVARERQLVDTGVFTQPLFMMMIARKALDAPNRWASHADVS